MEDISWDDAKIFLAVAEEGSFSGAAVLLGLGQPTVSRRVASFEDSLGYPLFHRGRRGTELTENGARLLPSVQQMARWANEMNAVVAGTEQKAEGTVSIAAPPGVAWELLTPFVAEQRERLPGIRFELLAAVDYVDLTRGEADIAIRLRPSDDPALETLAEVAMNVGVFGSPEYAADLKPGATVADLDWITWSKPYLHVSPRPELSEWIEDFEPAFASDHFLLQLRACELGLGAMILSSSPLLPNRRLVELDVGFPETRSTMYLVCARSLRWVPRVRAVLDELTDRMREFDSA